MLHNISRHMRICGYVIRRFNTSPSNNVAKEFRNQLYKKFLFYIHPDFFMQYRTMQDVNTSNLRHLQAAIETGHTSLHDNVRTLSFYLKPSDTFPEPRKVSVSLTRLTDSMYEIMETLGVELPPKPPSSASHSARDYKFASFQQIWVDSEISETIAFLESLSDRKDIIALKQEKYQSFRNMIQVVLQQTGFDKIEFWNSWSAKNNTLLLKSLLNTIDSSDAALDVPFAGMALIITNQTSFIPGSNDVDYIEGTAKLDCSLPAIDWMKTLTAIKQHHLKSRQTFLHDAIEMKKFVESHLLSHCMIDNSVVVYNQKRRVVMHINKGHTSSWRAYAMFLHDLHQELQNHYGTTPNTLLGDRQEDSDKQSQDKEVNEVPLSLNITIEEAQGTKLLSDSGTLRIDARNSPAQVIATIQEKYQDFITYSQSHEQKSSEINSLRTSLIATLQCASIKQGVGISDDMFLSFLRNINYYILSKQSKAMKSDKHKILGVLKHVHGLHLQVGRYCAILDDGVCSLPWDIKIA